MDMTKRNNPFRPGEILTPRLVMELAVPTPHGVRTGLVHIGHTMEIVDIDLNRARTGYGVYVPDTGRLVRFPLDFDGGFVALDAIARRIGTEELESLGSTGWNPMAVAS